MKTLLEIALGEYGVKEIVGEKDNPRILEYHKITGGFSDDETSWCSSFMNWCAIQAGLQRTGKPNARSWLEAGEIITKPEIGDIVIFKRGNSAWQGHVAVFINERDGLINVLGGNQGDMVKISGYTKSDLLGYRRLTKI